MSFTQPLNPHHPLGTMTISRTALRAMLLAALGLSITAAPTYGQILSDGDFDSLDVGSAPDNRVPAGAWEIVRNPLASHQFEDNPQQVSVVETSVFDPGSTGNSLRWRRTNGHVATQLRNLLNETIEESPNEIVRATFDVFVPDSGERNQGGFTVYLGHDRGFGGTRADERGPSVSWDIRGRLNTDECGTANGAGACGNRKVVRRLDSTPVDVWQHVQLDIDLANDNYDLFWSAGAESLELVSPYTEFRGIPKDEIDRITIAGFRSIPADGDAYIDNINIEILRKDWIGDANLDGQFDSVDIVEVLQAGKYDMDELAGWSQGDWNSDMRFDRLDIVAALQDGGYGQGPHAALAEQAAGDIQLEGTFAAIEPSGSAGDAQTSIVYNPGNGELSLDAPAGVELTSINIDSASGIFSGNAAQNLGGSFDNDGDGNIFKATFGSSFGSVAFGNVAQAGLSEEFVADDLTVVGSLAGGGDVGNVDLVYVPEPAAIALLACGLLVVLPRFQHTRV